MPGKSTVTVFPCCLTTTPSPISSLWGSRRCWPRRSGNVGTATFRIALGFATSMLNRGQPLACRLGPARRGRQRCRRPQSLITLGRRPGTANKLGRLRAWALTRLLLQAARRRRAHARRRLPTGSRRHRRRRAFMSICSVPCWIASRKRQGSICRKFTFGFMASSQTRSGSRCGTASRRICCESRIPQTASWRISRALHLAISPQRSGPTTGHKTRMVRRSRQRRL
mmetsp:Transcript_8298/g.21001  ORF Transcript_8298/g.21001 Transcript_8298/m.21001 type:complete len:226 (-) Transcript_8298:789-1466(-)